uniref:Uncharacterized protein n=1 Tax=Lepeophtheirus salmonis TaxID=72036 RepID=A0A0K2V2P1_LEPSM
MSHSCERGRGSKGLNVHVIQYFRIFICNDINNHVLSTLVAIDEVEEIKRCIRHVLDFHITPSGFINNIKSIVLRRHPFQTFLKGLSLTPTICQLDHITDPWLLTKY